MSIFGFIIYLLFALVFIGMLDDKEDPLLLRLIRFIVMTAIYLYGFEYFRL